MCREGVTQGGVKCARLVFLVFDEARRCDDARRFVLVLTLGYRHIVFL